MTDEQIKQKAEEYADSMKEVRGELEWVATRDDFIAGAHSRDEEIEHLSQREQMLFDREVELIAENDKLRNLWVRVEERLPEKGQSCFLANFDNRRCGYGKFCADDGILTRWERKEGGSTMIYCLHEVTHWMPIPKLEGGAL